MWLSGLDVVAADALALPGYYDPPPVICYLDRDIGAAIRRARTRMPGGGENPVAIIRVPRERMVGTGIASSLVHEVGHQAAALLDLVNSLRSVLRRLQRSAGAARRAWQLWERWISEIVADFWSVARVGIASTLGLIGVVSLPRAFVFRLNVDDPHPMPWIRVKLSAAIGDALYPHPQWQRLSATWESFYPPDGRGAGHAGAAAGAAGDACRPSSAAADQSPAAGVARPVARRSDGHQRAPARAAHRAVPVLAGAAVGNVSRRADSGLCRNGTGALRTASSVPRTRACCSASCSPSGRCAPR